MFPWSYSIMFVIYQLIVTLLWCPMKSLLADYGLSKDDVEERQCSVFRASVFIECWHFWTGFQSFCEYVLKSNQFEVRQAANTLCNMSRRLSVHSSICHWCHHKFLTTQHRHKHWVLDSHVPSTLHEVQTCVANYPTAAVCVHGSAVAVQVYLFPLHP